MSSMLPLWTPGPVQFQVNFMKEGQQFIGKSMKFQSLKLSFYTNSIPCNGGLERTSKNFQDGLILRWSMQI